MEPIFRGDETEGFGYGAHSVSLPVSEGQYQERNHHRVAESSRLARYSRPSDFGGRIGSSYQLGPRNARGDFPGAHRIERMASMNQAQDSNDDDGETSSASEDSTVSIGYPSPQTRAQRSAKRAEPCAEIRLPPSQRARLQPKETEPALHTGWSPAESPPSTHDSRRQLPRLAALEAIPHKPHQAQELNQKHLPTSLHQQHSSPQHSLQHGRMGSRSSPVIPQMQLPSLVGPGRPGVVSSSAVPAVHSTATSSPSPHPTMMRAVQHKQGSSVDHLRLPTPVNPQAVYEGWSHSDARQVPRTDSSAATAAPAERMMAIPVTSMAEHARGQQPWDTMWPPSNAYTGLAMERPAYGLDTRYDSQHENENGWIIQQDSTVANAAFGWAKAGGRQDSSQVMLARQGGSFAHQQPHQRQPNQRQEREQRQPFLPPRQQQTEARYPGQTMQPQVSRRREVSRTPSPVYRTPPPQSSPQYQPPGSKNPEHPRPGGWGAEEGGAADSLAGEWATGVPRPASGQAGKQILQRCLNHLNPKASREVWSHDEEEVLWRAQKEYGNAWSYIAGLLPGRSENAVKNHWYTQMRMFIGQRNAAGGKPPTGGVSGETFNVGTEGGGASKLVRHSRTQRRGDDRAEEARRNVGTPCSTSAPDPPAKKDDAAAARAEKEARAEAVAALELLFSQGERCDSPSATDVSTRPASALQHRRDARGSDSPRGRLPVFDVRRDSS